MKVLMLQSLAALNFGGPDGAKAGLVLGTVVSAGLLALYIKRTIDTGQDFVVTHASSLRPPAPPAAFSVSYKMLPLQSLQTQHDHL